MSRLLQHVLEEPRGCSYLAHETASLEHRVMLDVTPEEFDALLERGWRRFGPDYFRPACSPCGECVTTRIPTATFAPSKSQRRARRKAAGLRVMVGPPRVDAERLELYHAWHAEREIARAWSPSVLEPRQYFVQFAFPHPCAREVAFHDDEAGGRLVGVGICDETPRAWSLVYFFFDPAYAERSLGVANVVISVEIAARRGRSHVYLGYRVEGCPSLRYKASFGPREELLGRPEPDEAPRWIVAG
jgi:arginine-tRNA-protein transferase